MYTFFLGTNTALSAGEIAAVLTRLGIPFTIKSVTSEYLRLETKNPIPNNLIKILGGTIRICEDIGSWSTTPSVQDVLSAIAPLPPKWVIGLGSVGVSLNIRKVGVELKKAARAQGSKLSFIEPRPFTPAGVLGVPAVLAGAKLLNAAQVIFNKLTSLPNAELIFLQTSDGAVLVRTLAMQDISSYELRDTLRPARDAKVGLLPPKLAQIMINLGLPRNPENSPVVYDPFCGMGTILQEAWLMDIPAIGSDASEVMVRYAQENIAYVSEKFSVERTLEPTIFQHDVTSPTFPNDIQNKNVTVVTEPFLGTPQSRPLSPTEATDFYASVQPLYHSFFTNIKSVLSKGAHILILLPAPRVRENGKDTFTPLPRTFLDEIAAIGYRKSQLIPKEVSEVGVYNASEPLLYARPDAVIARELTLWERV